MSESNNRRRDGGELAEAMLRNRLAQRKHRKKRKMAEKENAALRKRVKELEAQIMQMRQQNGNGYNRNTPSVQFPEECCSLTTEELQQFLQSKPAFVHTAQFHHQNSANFLFLQTRISRSLSVSNSSISSRCSSAFSATSNYEDYSPSNGDDDYVPNCQTLTKDQNEHLSILNEYLDFNHKEISLMQTMGESTGPNQQSMEGNCFYEPMQNLVLTQNSASNGEQGGCILPSPIESFDLGEECDLITPMARGFAHQSDFGYDELDLITPRP